MLLLFYLHLEAWSIISKNFAVNRLHVDYAFFRVEYALLKEFGRGFYVICRSLCVNSYLSIKFYPV